MQETWDMGLIPWSGKSPGGGHGNPHQYSCLENPMGRGAWWATVHSVSKSQTWLSTHTHTEFWKALKKRGTFYWKSIDHFCILNRFISKHKTLVKRLLKQDFYVPESESLPRTNRRFQNQTYFLSHTILRVVFSTCLDSIKRTHNVSFIIQICNEYK